MQWLRRLLGWSVQPLGRRGERMAAKWLKRQGYEIIERNRTVGDDEADLIALDPDGKTVVIVEVKTRAVDLKAPEAFLTKRKQYHLARLASTLQRSPQYKNRPLRFDVIAIVWPDQGTPTVRHICGAFASPW